MLQYFNAFKENAYKDAISAFLVFPKKTLELTKLSNKRK